MALAMASIGSLLLAGTFTKPPRYSSHLPVKGVHPGRFATDQILPPSPSPWHCGCGEYGAPALIVIIPKRTSGPRHLSSAEGEQPAPPKSGLRIARKSSA